MSKDNDGMFKSLLIGLGGPLLFIALVMGGVFWFINSVDNSDKLANMNMCKTTNSIIESTFAGTYKMRRFSSSEQIQGKSQLNGSFFLIAGSLSGNSEINTDLYITFMWYKDGQYLLSKVPYSKTKFILDSNKTVDGTVSFERFEYECNDDHYFNRDNKLTNISNTQDVLAEGVSYVIFHVSEKDIPKNIKINGF